MTRTRHVFDDLIEGSPELIGLLFLLLWLVYGGPVLSAWLFGCGVFYVRDKRKFSEL